MGLPFVITQGVSLITDTAGNIADVLTSTADKNRLCTDATIRGTNFPYYGAEVILKDGRYRLVTDATVQVEQIFGRDNIADAWFAIGTFQDQSGVGGIGDTITVSIAAGDAPTLFPAYSKVFTVTAADTGATNPEDYLAERIVNELNADTSFREYWKASKVKDNSIVHISSTLIGERGQRPNSLDFQVTTTGTTVITANDDKIVTRGKPNSGARDPRDKRLVTVGISGEVTTTPGAVGDLFVEHPLNPTYNELMNVNGSVTPVEYYVYPDAEKDIFILEMRFYGNANGIKYGQFLSINTILANGILVEIKSDDQYTALDAIKSTDDFKNHFAIGGINWQVDFSAGPDAFLASWRLEAPFPLRKQGTFTADDYIKVTVRDNLSAILNLECLNYGFLREV